MNIFTKQNGSYSLIKEKQFDIIDEIKQLLLQQNQFSNKNIAIVGESGSGKTLLLLKLMQEL
jgi:DNA replication protein DnaC